MSRPETLVMTLVCTC